MSEFSATGQGTREEQRIIATGHEDFFNIDGFFGLRTIMLVH